MSDVLVIPQWLKEAITDAVKARGGKLQPSGEWQFPCVYTANHKRGDKDASASWNADKAVWTCYGAGCTGGGGAHDLAKLLGIDPTEHGPRFELNGHHAAPTAPSLASFCAERKLPAALLVDVFEIRETTHDSRPALRYPTARGDRIRFLDQQKPKYKFATTGHETLYNVGRVLELLRAGADTLYLVNGEPSVWACHAEGVPAFCLCVGEKAPSLDAVIALREALVGIPHAVRVGVAFDRDDAGQTATAHAVAALAAGGVPAIPIRLPADLPPKGDVDDLHRIVGARLGDVLAEFGRDAQTVVESPGTDDRVWQTILNDVALFADAPPPYWVERILQHVEPFATMFPVDWPVMMLLPYWAALWPTIRLQNLNTAVWTLGLGFQSTGKNLVTDELALIALTVAHRTTKSRVTLYTSGSIEGMYDALAGPQRQMICYQDEFANWLQFIKHRDYMAGIRGVLCSLYDSRAVGHVRSQKNGVEVVDPHVVFCATTTPSAFRQYADLEDLSNGYLSRFLICAPDAVQVAPRWFPQDDHRRRTLIDELIGHVKRLEGIERAEWQETGRADPPLIEAYAEHLGMNSGRALVLDDDGAEPPLPGGRLIVRVKKIAMLLELAEPSPNLSVDGNAILIRPEHVGSAIGIVERARAYTDRVGKWIGQSEDYRLTTKILGILGRRPAGITVRDLTKYGHASRRDVEGALKSLADAGQATSVTVGKTVRWLAVAV